jgi:hypothetical protein
LEKQLYLNEKSYKTADGKTIVTKYRYFFPGIKDLIWT